MPVEIHSLALRKESQSREDQLREGIGGMGGMLGIGGIGGMAGIGGIGGILVIGRIGPPSAPFRKATASP